MRTFPRQAIVTKYLPPTNTRGARVTARASAGSVTVPWNYDLGIDDNHGRAAVALCQRYGWPGTLVCGGMPENTPFAFVFVFSNALSVTVPPPAAK